MRRWGRWIRAEWLTALSALAVLPALWHLGSLIWIFAARLTYPMDLEWMEGGVLYQAHRLLHGESVFGSPDQGYVPFGYAPLHPAVLAGFGRVVGLDYWSGRLVSIVSVVLAAAVIYRELRRHGGDTTAARVVGCLGVGMAAAGFPVTGGWYDLIRNDSLALALPVAAAGLVSDRAGLCRGHRWIVVALLMAGSVLAKQTDVFFAVWIGVFAVATDRRVGLRVVALSAATTIGVLLTWHLLTGGWLLTWLGLMSAHDLQWRRLEWGLVRVLRFAPYLPLVPVGAVVLHLRGWLSRRSVLWLGMLLCAFPAGLLPFVKIGGYFNNLMPIVFLAGPVGLMLATDLLNGLQTAGSDTPHRPIRALVLAGVAGLLVVQAYPIDRFVPSQGDRHEAAELNDYLDSLDGQVLALQTPFLAVRNGVDISQLHGMAHTDAVKAHIAGTDVERFVGTSQAEWVLADWQFEFAIRRSDWFADERQVVPAEVYSVTGLRTAPRYLYRRVARSDRKVVFDFESERMAGWHETGTAFAAGPSTIDDSELDGLRNTRGDRFVSSADAEEGERAKGTLRSSPFVLDETHVGLLVGGGSTSATRVGLVISGQTVFAASGTDSNELRYVVWDVTNLRGQTAQIEIVDESDDDWGHILCDQVEVFSLA